MGLFDFVGDIWDGVTSFLGGPGGTVTQVGLDLFGVGAQYKANEAASKAQKRELDALRRANNIQTGRNVTDLRRMRMRSMARVNAMAAAKGANPDWGSPVTVRQETSRLYEQDISRLLEDAELRSNSISLQSAYAGKSASIANQAAVLSGLRNILSRF